MEINVLRRLERAAEFWGDRTAYTDDRDSLTFAQLTDGAKRIGSALTGRLGHRSPAAVMSGRRVLTPMIYLGIVYAGGFYGPMDAAQPEKRLRDILEVLNPEVMIVDRDNLEKAESLGFEGEILVAEELLEQDIDQPALDGIARIACPDDPLYVIFTSGSTGRPKGVITSHESLICYIDAYAEVMGIDETDVLGNQSPLDYIAAIRDIYLPIFYGASMYIIPKECFVMPAKLFEVMNERAVTSVGWSVSVFTIAVKVGAFAGGKPEHLKKVCFSGSVMPCSVLRVWQENLPGTRFVNQYGPTECTASCTYYEVDHTVRDDEVLPIGKPYRGYRVFLLDEEGRAVPQGGQGEICVCGVPLALGYYNSPEQTAAAFVQNPLQPGFQERMYRTGDQGMIGEDGLLRFCGRKDRQIKHLGHRVELSEIEVAALRLDTVTEACAMYQKEKELIWLFYTGTATVKEAAVHFRGIVPGFMVPRKLIQLESMPKLANGKTDMQSLRAMMK